MSTEKNRVVKIITALAISLLAVSSAYADHDAAPSPKLAGSEWLAVDVHGSAASDRTNSTIRFKKDGKIEGNTGCNTYSATLSVDGNNVRFENIKSGQHECRFSYKAAEQAFIGALDKTVAYSLNHHVLRFSDAKGQEVLKLRRLGTTF